MRIGLTCPYDWDVPGGVMAHIRDLSEELARIGHEVSVLAPAGPDAILPDYVVSAGRPVPLRVNGSVARITLGPGPVREIRTWLRNGQFDVIHVHEPLNPSVSGLAVWAARGPIVATFHASVERSRLMTAGAALAQTVLEKVGGRIAVSEKARQTIVEHLGGDAVAVPNGVNLAAFSSKDRLPDIPDDGNTLLFLGRIDEPRKGLAVLLEAMPAIATRRPGVRLIVAGPGDVDAVRAEMSPDLAARVQFLGMVSETDKARAFRSADVYVAPHTGGESFGIVLLEAMASETPVVASDLEAFSLVLEAGRCGELFPNGDVAALADSVIRVLEDRDYAAALVAEGTRRAARFDWRTVAREVLEVYDAVRQPGVIVTEDLRGQLVGRLAGFGRGGRE